MQEFSLYTREGEFDAFTVSAGDTLDINGQRMECSGAFVNSGTNTTGRVNFLTGKGKRKKYLGVVVK
mgnify:CR=1 FL=1